MSSIKISDLRPTGPDLFYDSESYMKDLTEEEIDIQGGILPLLAYGGWFVAGVLAGALASEIAHHH